MSHRVITTLSTWIDAALDNHGGKDEFTFEVSVVIREGEPEIMLLVFLAGEDHIHHAHCFLPVMGNSYQGTEGAVFAIVQTLRAERDRALAEAS